MAPARRWLTTFGASRCEVREAALQVLVSMRAAIVYLYAVNEKVVISAIERQRRLRIELVSVDAGTTRAIVTCVCASTSDRTAASQVLADIERRL
jgi:hypothetical protein